MIHTPEPWIFFKDRSNRVVVGPSTNYTVASCFITPEIDCCEANARRIVAAVNACAGIETYALELMTGELSLLNQITHKPQENPTKKAAQYRKQRDELLARGRATEGKWTTINALTSSVDSAKAAIAAAKAHE